MLSFSVNNRSLRVDLVAQIANQLNDFNREYATDAYIYALENKPSKINLNYFSKEAKKLRDKEQSRDKTIPLLSEEEKDMGYEGVLETDSPELIFLSFEEDIMNEMEKKSRDYESLTKDFWVLYQLIFRNDGFDFFKLLWLAKNDPSEKCFERLRCLSEKYGIEDFIKLVLCDEKLFDMIKSKY